MRSKKHHVRRRVDSPRNSGSARIEDLDFSDWWMDAWEKDGPIIRDTRYIHVAHKGHDGMQGTVHRVHPRRAKNAQSWRLAMRNGVLYWLIDKDLRSEKPKSK